MQRHVSVSLRTERVSAMDWAGVEQRVSDVSAWVGHGELLGEGPVVKPVR